MGGRIAGTHALTCHCCLPDLAADHETAAALAAGPTSDRVHRAPHWPAKPAASVNRLTTDGAPPLEEGLHDVTAGSMTGAPPRGLEDRLRDTRAKLESDVDLWVATPGSPGVPLIPLSYLWDGTAFLISTPRASVTRRNRDLPPPPRRVSPVSVPQVSQTFC